MSDYLISLIPSIHLGLHLWHFSRLYEARTVHYRSCRLLRWLYLWVSVARSDWSALAQVSASVRLSASLWSQIALWLFLSERPSLRNFARVYHSNAPPRSQNSVWPPLRVRVPGLSDLTSRRKLIWLLFLASAIYLAYHTTSLFRFPYYKAPEVSTIVVTAAIAMVAVLSPDSVSTLPAESAAASTLCLPPILCLIFY